MKLNLEGKRALVTGSTSGLGEAIARMLAAEGARVIVHGRNEKRAGAVATSLGTTFAIGDLATDAGADAVARVAEDIDILVNNAGSYHHAGWFDTPPADWTERYNANVVSGVRMIHRFVPGMRERRWGRVITIGGGLAIQPLQIQPDYSATLAARHNLSVSLARALAGTGVTSNVVSPGAILVDNAVAFLRQMSPGTPDAQLERDAVAKFIPNDIGRLGRPDEIAAAVCFLSSVHADYISGAVLRVDGGTIRAV